MKFKKLLCYLPLSLLCNCGPETKVVEREPIIIPGGTQLPPSGTGDNPDIKFKFSDIQNVIQNICSTCHPSFVRLTQSEVINSRICDEVEAKNMPKGSSLQNDVYTKFVAWCYDNS